MTQPVPPPPVSGQPISRGKWLVLGTNVAMLLVGFGVGRWSVTTRRVEPPPPKNISSDIAALREAAQGPEMRAQVELVKEAASAGGMIEVSESQNRAGLLIIAGKRVLCDLSDPPAKAAIWRESLDRVRRNGLIERSGGESEKIGAMAIQHTYWRLTSAAYRIIEATGGEIGQTPGRADSIENRQRLRAQWREEMKKNSDEFKQREDIIRRERGQ